MRTRFTRWLGESSFLWLGLFFLALIHFPPRLGFRLALLDSEGSWYIREHPWNSVVAAGCGLAALGALWFVRPEWRGTRRVLAGALFVMGLVSAFMVSSLMFFGFGSAAMSIFRSLQEQGARARPPLLARPHPGPPISILVLVIPILLALGATLLHARSRPGAVLPALTPEQQLLRSRHYLSAAPVMSRPVEGASRTLVLHPQLTREQLLDHVLHEKGWWAAEVLQRLDRRGVLASLPLTEEARVRSLALDSPVLVTPEGAPLTTQPLWGVVVEAEGPHEERLLLVSLGADEPTRDPAPTYALLLEEPATGGPPRLIQAEHVFPSASGYIGMSLPGLFILYLMGLLLAALPVAGLLHWRATRAPRSTDSPADGV